MYPSGSWRGWWEQNSMGRQPMEDFELRFAEGRIEGEGWDVVGSFVFRGQYDDKGSVRMVKQYLGAHKVHYKGAYDGEGTIFGEWTILGFDKGPFALTPVRARPAADDPIDDL